MDSIRAAYHKQADVILIFSQDQDLSEVADEIRLIAKEQNRWIKVASAFPFRSTGKNVRGINKTDWVHIDQNLYDSCLDNQNYRLP